MLPTWSVVTECAYEIHVPHLHICSDWLITMKANMGLYSDGTSYLGSRRAMKKILIKGCFFLGGGRLGTQKLTIYFALPNNKAKYI